MPLEPQDQNNYGVLVPTTFIFDMAEISNLDISDDFKETLIRLYMNLNRMSLALSAKENGYFPLNQVINGQRYFPNTATLFSGISTVAYRDVFRVVVDFGALPNAGVKTVPHNIAINAGITFTHIYGAASDPVGFNYIPIPYSSNAAATAQVQIDVDATNVIIDTGTINRSNFTLTLIVLEFMKY